MASIDSGFHKAAWGPGRRGATVVPSDTTVFEPSVLYVVASGNVTLVTSGGDTVVLPSVPAFTLLNMYEVVQVLATGTTSSSIKRAW